MTHSLLGGGRVRGRLFLQPPPTTLNVLTDDRYARRFSPIYLACKEAREQWENDCREQRRAKASANRD